MMHTCCQGTIKSYVNSYVARLNHSDAKYFKAQAINRQKFISLQTKERRCTDGLDHHSREVHEEIFIHQLPVKISDEKICMGQVAN